MEEFREEIYDIAFKEHQSKPVKELIELVKEYDEYFLRGKELSKE